MKDRVYQYLSDDEILRNLHSAALLYSQYAGKNLLFIYKKSLASEYLHFEVTYNKSNFMHLAGVKSRQFTAEVFYERCLAGTLSRKQFEPNHSRTNMCEKVSIMCQMLELNRCKFYKMGKASTILECNEFDMATGNDNGLIGYKMKAIKGIEESFPKSLLTGNIKEYCHEMYKVYFILQRDSVDQKYSILFAEIKQGLFVQEIDNLPEVIRNQIETERIVK